MADRGNVRVAARALAFARFRGGHADQQLADQIGRLWAVGLLDGQSCDGAILRDIGRRYGGLYWNQFAAMAPKTAQLERRDRSSSNDNGLEDRSGAYFMRLDEAAHGAGRDAVAAMHALCVDGWWFPDVDVGWIGRLIGNVMHTSGSEERPKGSSIDDQARLQAAIAALLAMVAGRTAAGAGSMAFTMQRWCRHAP